MRDHRHSFAINPALLGFAAVLLVFSIAASMDEPIFSRFTELFTANPAALGGLIALTSVAYLLTCEPAGALVDRAGTRHTIALGVTLEAISFFLFWLAQGIPLYIMAAMLAGIGSAITWSAARVFVADFSTDGTRGRAFGLYSTSWGFGWAIGPLVGGIVAAVDIRLTFLFAGLLMAVLMPVFLAVVPRSEDKKSLRQSLVSTGESAFVTGIRFMHKSTRPVRWLFVAYATTYMVWAIMWIFAPLLFEHFSNFEIGLIFFGNALAYAIGAFGAGSLADRRDKRPLLVGGFLTTAVGLLVFAMSNSFLMALALAVVLGFTLAFTQPIIDAQMIECTGKQRWGTVTGLVLVVTEIGTISASAVGGVIAAIGGFAAPFWFAVAVCGLAAIGSAITLK